MHRFRHHPQVVITELDGMLSLFQCDTCDYLTLNETGSAIWQALVGRPTLEEVCTSLRQYYEVDLDICRLEVKAWLEEALSKKIIIVVDPSGPSQA